LSRAVVSMEYASAEKEINGLGFAVVVGLLLAVAVVVLLPAERLSPTAMAATTMTTTAPKTRT